MDRREFLERLGILTAGAMVFGIPKGRSMVGWTRSREGLYVHKTFSMGFRISEEMLNDDLYGVLFESMQKVVKIPSLIRADGTLYTFEPDSGAFPKKLITH